MPPERAEVTKEWLKKCANDLMSAKRLLEGDPPLTDSAVFFTQQLAEKALKAFLTWHSVKFGKIHDLRKLGSQALQLDATLLDVIRKSIRLAPFAVIFRYPGEDDPPSFGEAKESLSLAMDVYDEILKRLPKETHP
jgi:HEPN domain-containing protein